MGASAPPSHQAGTGLQHAAGVERTSAVLELSRQDPKVALAHGGPVARVLPIKNDPTGLPT